MDSAQANSGLWFEQCSSPELNELHHSNTYLQNSWCVLVVRMKQNKNVTVGLTEHLSLWSQGTSSPVRGSVGQEM